MDFKTVREFREALYRNRDEMEFTIMFTSVLLEILNAYETEMKSRQKEEKKA